jgi:hypothetical protein
MPTPLRAEETSISLYSFDAVLTMFEGERDVIAISSF